MKRLVKFTSLAFAAINRIFFAFSAFKPLTVILLYWFAAVPNTFSILATNCGDIASGTTMSIRRFGWHRKMSLKCSSALLNEYPTTTTCSACSTHSDAWLQSSIYLCEPPRESRRLVGLSVHAVAADCSASWR